MKRLDNATIEALSGELNPHHTKQTKGKRSNHGRRAARMAGAGLPSSLPVYGFFGEVLGIQEATPRLRRGGLRSFAPSDMPVIGLYAGGIGSVTGLAGGPSGVIAGPSAGLSWLSVSGEGSWLPEVA